MLSSKSKSRFSLSGLRKRGVSAALDLLFTSDLAVDSRISYSGGAGGTYTDSTGTIRPHRGNYLLYSIDYTQSAWTPHGASPAANATTAPDGSNAQKLVEDGTNASHYFQQNEVVPVGFSHTISFFLKAAGRRVGFVYGQTSAIALAYFDLVNGKVLTVSGSAAPTATIVPAGNGWWRCALTWVTTASSIAIGAGAALADGVLSYQGDGASGLYMWGAMLDPVGSLLPFIPTTSAAVSAPRIDFDPVTHTAKGMLVEEQRTNLLTYSSDYTQTVWGKGAASITANATTAPDGTATAQKLVENTATTLHYMAEPLTLAAQAYTFSVFLKAAERTQARISVATSSFALGGSAIVDLTNGAVSAITNYGTTTGTFAGAYSVGGGWYRAWITVTGTAASYFSEVDIFNGGIGGYTGDGVSGIYPWGAQLEVGSFATSYIPTTNAQVTRTRDAISQPTTGWYSSGAGTILAEYDYLSDSGSVGTGGVFSLDHSGGAAYNVLMYARAAKAFGLIAQDDTSTIQFQGGGAAAATAGQAIKSAFRYSGGNYAITSSTNAGAIISGAGADVMSLPDTLYLGGLPTASGNLHLKRLRAWRSSLSDAAFQGLVA